VPRAQWQGTAQAPTIAFLGRIDEPRKGLPVLSRALPQVVAAYPGLRVLVAGHGDEEAARERLSPDVSAACEFLGGVSDEDKAALLASVDLYVAPHTGGESFGIVLIEAMSACAPVLASDLAAFSRVLDGGAAGEMFASEDADDLARHLLALLADPVRRAELGARGRKRADQFDWSVVAADVMAVYETVTSGAPRVSTTAEPTSMWHRLVRGGRTAAGS